jgi:hypothetical protein
MKYKFDYITGSHSHIQNQKNIKAAADKRNSRRILKYKEK